MLLTSTMDNYTVVQYVQRVRSPGNEIALSKFRHHCYKNVNDNDISFPGLLTSTMDKLYRCHQYGGKKPWERDCFEYI